jgi:DNA polymerase-1
LSVELGPAWVRGFLQAPPGWALVELDFEAEEFVIRAAQSGDPAMIRAYQSGDPYMATGVLMGLAPPGATKFSHPEVRALCKVLVLAISYGMSAWGLAQRLAIEEGQAAELIRRYHEAFPVARAWSEGGVAYAKAYKSITTPFGWRMYVPRNTNPRTLLNWPMQSLGADLLRLIAIALVEAGIKVINLMHDAVLIECGSKTSRPPCSRPWRSWRAPVSSSSACRCASTGEARTIRTSSRTRPGSATSARATRTTA